MSKTLTHQDGDGCMDHVKIVSAVVAPEKFLGQSGKPTTFHSSMAWLSFTPTALRGGEILEFAAVSPDSHLGRVRRESSSVSPNETDSGANGQVHTMLAMKSQHQMTL